MTTPEQLEELKAKYPLAFEWTTLPVKYDTLQGNIIDANEKEVAIVSSDQIGELICELLNQLK